MTTKIELADALFAACWMGRDPDHDEKQVYFIRAKNSGMVKIGSSYHPRKRLAQLQSGNQEELELLFTIMDVSGFERWFHRVLKNYRVRGEWFALCGELAEAVDRFRALGFLGAA